MADADKPIIIIKKKGGHGGHHGGAWKVAYADFVTAMMAFFMVMWLLNSAQAPTRQAIAHYFRKPGWMQQQSATILGAEGVGILPEAFGPSASERVSKNSKWEERRKTKTSADLSSMDATDRTGSKGLSKKPAQNNDPNGTIVDKKPDETVFDQPNGPTERGRTQNIMRANESPVSTLEKKKAERGTLTSPPPTNATIAPQIGAAKEAFEHIRNVIERQPELREILGDIEIKMDLEGITLEIMDTEKASMFAPGSTKILPRAEQAFSGVVNLLEPLPYPVDVIGHTDATQFASFPSAMSNWDLSALRANEARKVLQANGFPAGRVLSVIGKADTDLRFPDRPYAAGNRRITIRLKFANRLITGTGASDQRSPERPPTRAALALPTPVIKPPAPIATLRIAPTPQPTASPTRTPANTASVTPRPLTIAARVPFPSAKRTEKPLTISATRATPANVQPFPVLKPGQLAQERIGFDR